MIADLLTPLLEASAWPRLASWRLSRDPLFARIPPRAERPMLEAARAAGVALAESALARGWASAEVALADLGVRVVVDGGGDAPALVQHALYTTPPPTVVVYAVPIAALERLIDAEGLDRVLGEVDVRELVLTHELFHHLVALDAPRPAISPRVDVLRFYRWRRTAVVRAAEEIGAAAFTARWHRLSWPPELLDVLTLVACRPAAGLDLLHSLVTSS